MMVVPVMYDRRGQPRRFGNLPPAAGLTKVWRVFGDVPATPMFPRSQWDALLRNDLTADPWLQYVHDQADVGQCNCEATTAAMEAARAEQGLPFVKLSPADLYDRINGGADNGSTLEDGLHQALAVGVGTAATSGLLWHPGMHDAPAQERAQYRVLQAFLCPTFEHCFSAAVAGFKLISGVLWYANYDPDGDGWLPAPQGSPVGGHAVFGHSPCKRGSTYGIGHRQSWGLPYGIGGSFVLPEVAYRDGAIGGWWAVREVVDSGAGVPAPAQ